LPEEAGKSPTYFSNILTGMRNPGTKTLERIASAFGVTMAEFYGGPPEASSPETSAHLTFHDAVRRDIDIRSQTAPDSFETSRIPGASETRGTDDVVNEQDETETLEEIPPQEETERDESEPDKTGLTLSDTSPDKLEKLFDSMGVSCTDLFSLPSAQTPVIKESPDQKPDKTPQGEIPEISGKIPLLTQVPQGDWRKWFDSPNRETFTVFVPRFTVQGDHIFAVRIDDSSMVPDLYEGDLLVINPEDKFTNIDGGIGVVVSNDRIMIRKIYLHTGEYLLVPTNSAHKKEVAPLEGTRIFKVALWIPVARGKF
jgi:SOS-response transcriptional repressor LexA